VCVGVWGVVGWDTSVCGCGWVGYQCGCEWDIGVWMWMWLSVGAYRIRTLLQVPWDLLI